jgi:hypothetical protein
VWLEVKVQFYGIPVAGKRSSVPIPKSTSVLRLERATIIRVTIKSRDLKDDLARADHTLAKITQTAERKPPKLRTYRHRPRGIPCKESTRETKYRTIFFREPEYEQTCHVGGETQVASGVSGLATLIGLHDCTLDIKFIHFVDSPLVLRTSSFFLFSVPAIHSTFHNISLNYGISSNLYMYQVTCFISGLPIYIQNLHLTKYRQHLQTLHQTTSQRCRTHRPRKLLPLPIL